jgi:hypothetical protein
MKVVEIIHHPLRWRKSIPLVDEFHMNLLR